MPKRKKPREYSTAELILVALSLEHTEMRNHPAYMEAALERVIRDAHRLNDRDVSMSIIDNQAKSIRLVCGVLGQKLEIQ